MSHFTKLKVVFRDLDAISRAVERMGGRLTTHDHPRLVKNRWGNQVGAIHHIHFPDCPSDLYLEGGQGDWKISGDFFDILLTLHCPFSESGRYPNETWFEQSLTLNYAIAQAEKNGASFEDSTIERTKGGELRLKGTMKAKKKGLALS